MVNISTMARVIIENCLSKVKDRFELVMLAAQRTRELNSGATPNVENNDNDKTPVVALREIESGTLDLDAVMNATIMKYKVRKPLESPAFVPTIPQLDVKEGVEVGDEIEKSLDDLLSDEDGIDLEVEDIEIADEDQDAVVVEKELINEGAQIYSDEEENVDD